MQSQQPAFSLVATPCHSRPGAGSGGWEFDFPRRLHGWRDPDKYGQPSEAIPFVTPGSRHGSSYEVPPGGTNHAPVKLQDLHGKVLA